MDIIKAIVLGLVEGVTEWLPVSSTGHLILVEHFFGLSQSAAFKEMFDVVIQLGAILSVVVLYFRQLNPWSRGKSAREVQLTWQLWAKIVVACLPAFVFGLLLDNWLNAHFYNFVFVALMLILYGAAFIWVERRWVPDHALSILSVNRLSYRLALYIGLFQVLSLLPGTSRSGVTIIGALLLGVSRGAAAEFTFFLGVPIMLGASVLKIAKYLLHNVLTAYQFLILLVACVVAFTVSMLAIRWLMRFVKSHDFTAFGKYRIVLGALLLLVAAATAFVG